MTSENKENLEGSPPEGEHDERSDGTGSPHSQEQNSDQPPPWWNLALQQLDRRFAVLQANMEKTHSYVTDTVASKTDATKSESPSWRRPYRTELFLNSVLLLRGWADRRHWNAQ